LIQKVAKKSSCGKGIRRLRQATQRLTNDVSLFFVLEVALLMKILSIKTIKCRSNTLPAPQHSLVNNDFSTMKLLFSSNFLKTFNKAITKKNEGATVLRKRPR
jgi:hypothetical protein